MAENTEIQVRFFTKLSSFKVTENPFSVPSKLTRYGLSEIINHLLSLDRPRVFDFLVDGEFLRTSLDKFIAKKSLSAETVLAIEYVEAISKPQQTGEAVHDNWVSCVAGAQGFATTGCYDNHVRVWRADCSLVATLSGHTSVVKAVAWVRPPDSNSMEETVSVVAASKDHSLRSWKVSLQSGQSAPTAVFSGHTNSVNAVAASPTQKLFCSGCWDGLMHIWHAIDDSGVELPQGDALENGHVQGKKKAGDAKKRRLKDQAAQPPPTQGPSGVLTGHIQCVSSVVWPASDVIYSASWDHSIRRWDVETTSQVSRMDGDKAINSLSCSQLSGLVATGSADPVVRIWDPRTSVSTGSQMQLKSHTGWVSSVSWAAHRSHLLVSASYDGSIKLWDIRSHVPLHTIPAHADKALCCDWLSRQATGAGSESESELEGRSEWCIVSGGSDSRMHVYAPSRDQMAVAG